VNLAMKATLFDPDDAYLGYAPITVIIRCPEQRAWPHSRGAVG
jgi:hypothetical protein